MSPFKLMFGSWLQGLLNIVKEAWEAGDTNLNSQSASHELPAHLRCPGQVEPVLQSPGQVPGVLAR